MESIYRHEKTVKTVKFAQDVLDQLFPYGRVTKYLNVAVYFKGDYRPVTFWLSRACKEKVIPGMLIRLKDVRVTFVTTRTFLGSTQVGEDKVNYYMSF